METLQKRKEIAKVLIRRKLKGVFSIRVYNDDINTFEHVIETFIRYCKHTPEQAEQCAWIIHTKGKCTVKSGSFFHLIPICVALLDQGISAEVLD